MFKSPKAIFIFLSFIIIGINGYLHSGKESASLIGFLGGGLGGSMLSIPVWSCIGVILANIGLFFWKIIRPVNGDELNIWQKASLGLIAGIFLKPLLGIVW